MGMDRMFRVLAFFLFAITLMFFAGDMATVAGLFLFRALVFLVLSYFRLLNARTCLFLADIWSSPSSGWSFGHSL